MSNAIKEQVLKEYDALASDYDERWLSYTEKTLALTLATLQQSDFNPKPMLAKQSLLDVGCGTGQFLERVASLVPELALSGIEPNREMLLRAQTKFANKVNCVEAWAHELPFEDASFDYVTSNNMFHYIDEPLKALTEFKRVLRPNGQLILMDWCADFWTMKLNARYLDMRKKAHVKTYSQSELEAMLEAIGFVDVVVERTKVDMFWGMMVARAFSK